jgi:hypothetical protein
MRSYQASLWRDMAREAMAVANRTKQPDIQRQMLQMAARYLAMAERVDEWTAVDQEKPE